MFLQNFSMFYPKEVQTNMNYYYALERASEIPSGDEYYEEKDEGECPSCNGTGKVKEWCKECDGYGQIKVEH